MRRTIYSLAGILILAVSSPAFAQSFSCNAKDGVRVAVTIKDPKAKINHTKTLKYINNRAKHGGLRTGKGMVLGLTHSAQFSNLKFEFQVRTLGNRNCFNITSVNASFGHKTLEVFIPREYHPGTCQYNTVMRHEKEHVRVNREGVRKYAKLLHKELKKAVSRYNPRQTKNPKTAQEDARKTLGGAMRRVSKKFQRDIAKKHAVIDKPGGPYDATGACRKWQ
ncbi:hypothetical protein V5T82_17410 [Magnetovibrio sp. PR-2]|uniref:hypothetical protein n=1 Tax=Magnetovibrio sp. PR-2 TaxID=3120356 RepID=UPI002FCE175E